jgi:hypothetical protein
MTTTYTIRSVKHTETFRGALRQAIERAQAINEEYQPAFGVQVETEDGATQWDSEDLAEEVHCECGEATGVRCEWTGPKADTVAIDWMPESLRESHRAARNSGRYPHNGALRLRVNSDCAEMLEESDPDWTSRV